MRDREGTQRPVSPAEGRQAARKPYQKPAVRYERVFETSALTCGKVHTTQSGCHQVRKNS